MWMRRGYGIVLAAVMLAMAACNGVSQTSTPATVTTAYTLTSGVCYITGTTTVVSSTYCGTTTTTSGYTLSGGVCYITGTTTVVNSTYCGTTTTTSGYTLSGGVCYMTGTTTVVNSTYCGTTTTTGAICLGNYYQPGYGWGACNGQNCRGMYLYNQSGVNVWCP